MVRSTHHNSFVGYEQIGNGTDTTTCRCLFSGDGYPSPIPPYVNPAASQLSIGPNDPTHLGMGPVSTSTPEPNHKCFRYIVSFAFHSNFNHQVIYDNLSSLSLYRMHLPMHLPRHQ